MFSSRGKIKLLAVKLSALQQELDLSKQILQTASRNVDEMFREKYDIPKKESDQLTDMDTACAEGQPQFVDPTQERVEVENEKQNMNPETKKIYRQIALKIHPDKLLETKSESEKQSKIDLFQKATKAAATNDLFLLASIAEEIGIKLPDLPREVIKETENKIIAIKKEINHIESTYVWRWNFCEDPDQKASILNELFELMYAKNFRT
jgi:hypothetical protein